MYCTKQDLIDRFSELELIQLTDRERIGAIGDAALTSAITDANADINAYLGKSYSLPLASTPTVINRLACDLVRFYLHVDQDVEPVKTRYYNAIKMLELISTGRLSIGLDAQQSVVQPTDASVSLQSGRTVFRREP